MQTCHQATPRSWFVNWNPSFQISCGIDQLWHDQVKKKEKEIMWTLVINSMSIKKFKKITLVRASSVHIPHMVLVYAFHPPVHHMSVLSWIHECFPFNNSRWGCVHIWTSFSPFCIALYTDADHICFAIWIYWKFKL